MKPKSSNLIWIDLEMTGLDTIKDQILQIATVITDKNLNPLAEGPDLVIHQPESVLAGMDEWNTKQHSKSGLLARVRESTLDREAAEAETLDFIMQFVPPQKSPMCGNSICQDRRFLARLMPKLERYFHYRHLDVSTLKVLAQHWAPKVYEGFKKSKKSSHLAMDDVRESIEELRYYRGTLFALPQPQGS